VLKLPDWPPVLMSVQLPPPELELLELLEEELDELLDEELLLLLDELLLDELDEELLELLDELEPPLLIEPVDAVRVTLSSFAPSSRRSIRSVWEPAARPLKAIGAMVPQPLVIVLFWRFQAPESSL
jgi:hypothetical protein